jgi:hypothetical protein
MPKNRPDAGSAIAKLAKPRWEAQSSVNDPISQFFWQQSDRLLFAQLSDPRSR